MGRRVCTTLMRSVVCVSVPLHIVLVGLYEEPERPTNAVDYIKRYMGAPTNIDVEAIKAENESYKKQIAELTASMSELQKQVSSADASNVALTY